jgi:cytidylate kinase
LRVFPGCNILLFSSFGIEPNRGPLANEGQGWWQLTSDAEEAGVAIITISRGTFSGGQQLAACLGQQLGYEIVSREVISEAACKYGVSESKLGNALERGPGFWDRFSHERRRYLAFIQSALCEHVARDNVVYHGHAGHLLLRGVRHVLRVRLIAPLEMRIEMVSKRMHLTHEDAVAHIEKVDRERARWTRFLHGVDWHDPHLYDLIVNLEHVDLDAACESVAAIARRKQFQADADSRKAMNDLRLASRARAALAADRSTANAEVEVRADDGDLAIEGKLQDPQQVEAVIERARLVPGVARVQYGTRMMLRDPDA